jgi:hypothetical protein
MNSMSNKQQWIIRGVITIIAICTGVLIFYMISHPPSPGQIIIIDQTKFYKHKAIFTYESKEYSSTWKRTFEDTTYIRRAYWDNQLRHVAYGHWHVDSLECLKIVFDSAFQFDTTWEKMVPDDNWIKDNPSFILSFRNLNKESIEFFRESDEQDPAHWEIWHKVM